MSPSPFGPDADNWISQPKPAKRTTEALLPVTISVHPTWVFGKGGCWQAELCVLGRGFWDCDHGHSSIEEAFGCGEGFLQETLRQTLARR